MRTTLANRLTNTKTRQAAHRLQKEKVIWKRREQREQHDAPKNATRFSRAKEEESRHEARNVSEGHGALKGEYYDRKIATWLSVLAGASTISSRLSSSALGLVFVRAAPLRLPALRVILVSCPDPRQDGRPHPCPPLQRRLPDPAKCQDFERRKEALCSSICCQYPCSQEQVA